MSTATTPDLAPLLCLADLGQPDTTLRQAWTTLVTVHGMDAVAWACVRCLSACRPGTRVSNEQAQRVLDGGTPNGGVVHWKPGQRRPVRQKI